MKKLLILLILFSGLIFPLACSDNNSNKGAGPTLPGGGTGSGGGLGVDTATPVPLSLTVSPTPVFMSNYGTSTSPNGFYYNQGTNTLYVAEGSVTVGSVQGAFERYQVGAGTLSPAIYDDLFITGFPTPSATPAWAGTTLIVNCPQGYAYTTGYYAMLDAPPNAAATLWMGCISFALAQIPAGSSQYPGYTWGFGTPSGPLLNSPRALVGDSLGNVYVADTGNGFIDQFGADCPAGPFPSAGYIHRWNGFTSNTPLKKPVALAIDTSNNLYVGDAGYSPSFVDEYSPGGTTILGSWQLQTGCVINGLAVDSLGDFYVSDTSGGGKVEEYKIVNLTTANLVRVWGDPHGPHEYLPFVPSAIALIEPAGPPVAPSYFIVGDTNNDLLNIFGP